jgi:hypothetical protein
MVAIRLFNDLNTIALNRRPQSETGDRTCPAVSGDHSDVPRTSGSSNLRVPASFQPHADAGCPHSTSFSGAPHYHLQVQRPDTRRRRSSKVPCNDITYQTLGEDAITWRSSIRPGTQKHNRRASERHSSQRSGYLFWMSLHVAMSRYWWLQSPRLQGLSTHGGFRGPTRTRHRHE